MKKIGAALKRKLGPLPAWAWLTIVAVGVFFWRRSHPASSTGSTGGASGSSGAADSGGGDYWTGGGSGSSNGGGGSDGYGPPPDSTPSNPPPSSVTPATPTSPLPASPAPGQKKPSPRRKRVVTGHPKPHKTSGAHTAPRHRGRTKTHKARPVHHAAAPAKPPKKGSHAHAEPPKRRAPGRVQPARHTVTPHPLPSPEPPARMRAFPLKRKKR